MFGNTPEHVGTDLHVIVESPGVGDALLRVNQLNVR